MISVAIYLRKSSLSLSYTNSLKVLAWSHWKRLSSPANHFAAGVFVFFAQELYICIHCLMSVSVECRYLRRRIGVNIYFHIVDA